MHKPDNYIAEPFYHFSFLKDIKVHGIYLNSVSGYLGRYPFLKDSHYHDFYSVILLTEGIGSVKICNESYDAHAHTLFLIPPSLAHSLDGLDHSEGLVFFFCQDFYVEEFSYIRLLNVSSWLTHGGCRRFFSGEETFPLSNILESIRAEYESACPSGNSPVIIRSLLNIFLLKMAGLFESASAESVRNDSTLIHSLSHLIESYYYREHSIGFYARAVNISEKRLNEICNRHFSCGLKKILNDRIMQESRRLLVSSELSVSEIAYKLSFEDDSYFNKVFRKTTGITPKRFREIHQKFLP